MSRDHSLSVGTTSPVVKISLQYPSSSILNLKFNYTIAFEIRTDCLPSAFIATNKNKSYHISVEPASGFQLKLIRVISNIYWYVQPLNCHMVGHYVDLTVGYKFDAGAKLA